MNGASPYLASAYGWTPANQIASTTRSNDAFVFTGDVNVSRSYMSNGLNQYKTAGAASFTYDGSGNLTSDGSINLTYDNENRLRTASGAKSAALSYDPLGRLWQTSGGAAGTTRFLYDGDALVAEYNGSNQLLRRYVHGPGVDEPLVWYEGAGLTDRRTLHADHQGSIVAVANSAGNALAINSYDAWGIPGASNLGRFQYTGQIMLPEIGFYHYKARIYSPTLGRFLQTDPVGYEDQVNLYAYVANDPVNNVDPSGKIVMAAPAVVAFCSSGGCAAALIATWATTRWATGQVLNNDDAPRKEPPSVTPDDLKDKTADQVRDIAKEKGLVPDPKKADKFRDPETGKERIRIDPGHVDKETGKPFDNPNAAGPHAHGYGPDGKTPVRDPDTNDKHFPLKPE